MVYDVTSAALHSALRGISTRRRVLADNMANVETPNYLAGRVNFEDAIAAALEGAQRGRSSVGDLATVSHSMSVSTDATRVNGNNVDLDDEIMGQTTNELAYSTVLEGMNSKFRLLRTAIGGGA